MGKMPEVCVSLYSHSVQDIIREAGRAAVALADSVEVRFDQLWLIPRSARETSESGEETALEESIRPLDDVNVEEAIQAIVDGIELPILFTCAPSAAPDQRVGPIRCANPGSPEVSRATSSPLRTISGE